MDDKPADLVEKGLALHRGGAIAEAVALYDEALRRDPGNAEAPYYLAVIACRQGRFADGVALARQALAAAPGSGRTHNILGLALHRLGRREEALIRFIEATSLAPELAEAHGNRGVLLDELGRHSDALACFERALALNANSAVDWCNRGIALRSLRRHAEALASFDRALALKPEAAEIHHNRGVALSALDRAEEALESFERAIAGAPGFAEAHAERGRVLNGLGRFEEALASHDRALALRPNYAVALANRGNAYRAIGRLNEADADYARALKLDSALAAAHLGRGHVLMERRQLQEAQTAMERARSIEPDNPETANSLAHVQLLLGDWTNGFRNYEAREYISPPAYTALRFARWTDEVRPGDRLVLLTEQGFGDIINFSRFAPILAAMGQEVTVLARPELVRLLSTLHNVRVAASIDDMHYDGRPLRWLPLMSVAGTLGITPTTIPSDVPYLAAEPARVEAWAERIGRGGFKVGIAWQTGVTTNWYSRKRSMPLAEFAPLAALPGVRLISLQKGAGSEQVGEVAFGGRIETLGEDFDSGIDAFVDTAAVMANLDLIVACDTSVAHLAGALARPVFVGIASLPDWRWLLDGEDTLWYPTMRLFRQTVAGDWRDVFARISKAVSERTAGS